MTLHRRDFLIRASMAAAALALDPERLLWVPGQKTIFLPTPRRNVELYVDTSGLMPGAFRSLSEAMASLPPVLTAMTRVTVIGSPKTGPRWPKITFKTTPISYLEISGR